MPVRIVMVIAKYPPVIGGTERACQRLSAALVRAGHHVTVLTRRVAGAPAEEVDDGVHIVRLPAPGPRAMAASAFILSAIARLRTIPHDVVHCHQALSPATIGALARRLGGRPVVVKLAGPGAIGDLGTVQRGLFAKVRRWLLGAISGWICPSQELVAEIRSYLPGARSWHVPNGVDAVALTPLPPAERDILRRQLGIEGRTILFTGALRPEKNLPLLVRAVAALPPDVRLAIVGEGGMRSQIEQAVRETHLEDRVRLVGAVNDVRPWLLAADAFALPSASEGMSNSLLEAMAAALPIVASNVPGNAGLVRDGEHASLCPPGDQAALTAAFARVLAEPALALRLGTAARQRILSDYALDSVALRVAEIYAEL